MAYIPDAVYGAIEKQLYRRKTAAVAARARLDALREQSLIRSPGAGTGGGHGGVSAPTEKAAMAVIEAEEELSNALAWHGVFDETDRVYVNDEHVLDAVRCVYGGMTQADVAAQMDVDRQTVRRYIERYVCTAAVIAAEAGLIKCTSNTDAK